MYKTHPFFWCSILGQKSASYTRDSTVVLADTGFGCRTFLTWRGFSTIETFSMAKSYQGTWRCKRTRSELRVHVSPPNPLQFLWSSRTRVTVVCSNVRGIFPPCCMKNVKNERRNSGVCSHVQAHENNLNVGVVLVRHKCPELGKICLCITTCCVQRDMYCDDRTVVPISCRIANKTGTRNFWRLPRE